MKTSLRSIFFGIVLTLLVLPVPSVFAGPNAVNIFPADSAPYGRTYAEWMASWQQWAIAIPATAHPLFDNVSENAGASIGQSGPVFFLGGKFCRFTDPNCGTNNVVRNITVPAGKAFFFPIIDAEVSTVETGGGHESSAKAVKDISGLRQLAEQFLQPATNVWLEVDGTRVPNLVQNFHVQSTAFQFYLPENDIFTAVGEGNFTPGYYFPGVDDGYVVMLRPLSSGRHTIHFHAEVGTWVLDITYNVMME